MKRPPSRERRKSWGAAALGLGLLLVGPALADDEAADGPDYTRPGLYLGLNGLSAIENFNRPFNLHPSAGLNGRIGWRGDEYMSQEIEFAWRHGFKGAANDAVVTQYDITLNFKWYLPFEELQPYLLTGLGALISRQSGTTIDPDNSDTAFLAKFGIGLDYYVTEHIAANVAVDYGIPVSNGHAGGDHFASFSAGLLYRF